MYSYRVSTEFKKCVKRCKKRGLDMQALKTAIDLLVANGFLPETYHPHKLSGAFAGLWECHIQPDWLLVWDQNDTELTLLMIATGSHSDIFG